MKTLILASQSPRRSEILKKAGYQFVPFPVHVSEIPNENLSLDERILDIAKRKSQAVIHRIHDEGLALNNNVILAADTMVCMNSRTLGKPENENMAYEFLRLLSDNKHYVKTAVFMYDLDTQDTLSHIETTTVYFRKITDQEIQDYIKTKEPLDKAGAYAIQGIGRQFVKKYEGDFDNVVGLPLHALEKLFTIKGWFFSKTF